MMRNNRDGSFRDVTAQSGLDQNNTRYSFCLRLERLQRRWMARPLRGELIFGRKNLYRNNGDGTFTDVAPQAGVEDVGAGMSVCWTDFDQDGAEDIYVADMWTLPANASLPRKFSRKTRPRMSGLCTGSTRWATRSFENSGAAFEDRTRRRRSRNGTLVMVERLVRFSIMRISDLYIANGMVSGVSREDLNSFFWRQVVANSPDQPKPLHDYEQGWSAINETHSRGWNMERLRAKCFYANNRDGTFSDVSGAVAWTLSRTEGAFCFWPISIRMAGRKSS